MSSLSVAADSGDDSAISASQNISFPTRDAGE
jgi:hypothetical protein